MCAENLIRVAGVNESPKLARCQTAPLATPTGLSSRTKIARLIMLAGFSLTMLLTGMERAMADFTVARRVLQVEHITIKTTKKFAEVEAALERSVPQLDPAIAAALANGNEQRATELEQGAQLFIFLSGITGRFCKLPDAPQRPAVRNWQSAYCIKDDPPSFGGRPLCAAARHTLRRRNGWLNFRIQQAVVSLRRVWR